MKKTDYLILGCGYLGLRVARRWVAQGRSVAAVTRQPERLALLTSEGITPFLGDVLDLESLQLLPQASTVLYAVGHDRRSGRTMAEGTLQGLSHMMDWWRGRQAPRTGHCIYISSTSVYGQTDGSWVDESAPCEPLTQGGTTILTAERQLQVMAHQLPGLTLTILRLAGIYGPGRLLREQALRLGEPIVTNPDGWLNLIHVEDAAQIVVAVALQPRTPGLYNVSDDTPVRRRDFYNYLSTRLNTTPPRFIPPNPLAVPGYDTADRKVTNHRLKTTYQLELKYPDYRAGLEASLRCGGEPRELNVYP